MSQEITYRCDVCKKPKGEANHWFLARRNASGNLTFGVWSLGDAREENTIHLCGEQCVQKKVSEFCNEKA
jgi:hypothetical protein